MKNDFIGFTVVNGEYIYSDENPVKTARKHKGKRKGKSRGKVVNSNAVSDSLGDSSLKETEKFEKTMDSELFTIDTGGDLGFTIDTAGEFGDTHERLIANTICIPQVSIDSPEESFGFTIDTTGDPLVLEEDLNFILNRTKDFIPLSSKAKQKKLKKQIRNEIEDDYIQNAEFDLEYLQRMKIVDFNDFIESNSDESEVYEQEFDSDFEESSSDSVEIRGAWEYDEDEFHEKFSIKKKDPFEERLNGNYNLSKSQSKKQRKMQLQDDRKEKKQVKQKRKETKSKMDHLINSNDQTKLKSYIQSQQDRIKQFVRSGHDCFITDPMPKELRHIVQGIAKQFNTTVKVIGKQDKKMLQIFRKSTSYIPENVHYELKPIKIKQFKPKKEKVKKKEKNVDKSDRLKVGDVVGQNIKPIDSDNVGHMMMQMMGWQGGGLKEDGIVEPIQVVVRSKRTGLGGI
ncbi:squalene synthetase-like protein [Boothiomyces sp. JEL0866]|nr:squalene synthetase-like protein [Boothiomyces sp. JEL0866]